MKTWIQVPSELQAEVIAKGAIFDKRTKRFFVPSDQFISPFNKFIPLTIELVPSSNWKNNVRSECFGDWDNIRRASYKRAGYRCEVCSGVGPKHPAECHEIWDFDMKTKIQKLIGVISLCPPCHKVKHIGLAFVKGDGNMAMNHLKIINGWTDDDANKYIEEAFRIYEVLSSIDWTLDLSLLGDTVYA